MRILCFTLYYCIPVFVYAVMILFYFYQIGISMDEQRMPKENVNFLLNVIVPLLKSQLSNRQFINLFKELTVNNYFSKGMIFVFALKICIEFVFLLIVIKHVVCDLYVSGSIKLKKNWR